MKVYKRIDEIEVREAYRGEEEDEEEEEEEKGRSRIRRSASS